MGLLIGRHMSPLLRECAAGGKRLVGTRKKKSSTLQKGGLEMAKGKKRRRKELAVSLTTAEGHLVLGTVTVSRIWASRLADGMAQTAVVVRDSAALWADLAECNPGLLHMQPKQRQAVSGVGPTHTTLLPPAETSPH